MSVATITKSFTWHMGHRLPNHNGKCRNLHGHTYKVEIAVCGIIQEAEDDLPASGEGMVADFDRLKQLWAPIEDTLDHHCLLSDSDELCQLLSDNAANRLGIVQVGFMPTAENIAWFIYTQLEDGLDEALDTFTIANVTVWETPTSSAAYHGE